MSITLANSVAMHNFYDDHYTDLRHIVKKK